MNNENYIPALTETDMIQYKPNNDMFLELQWDFFCRLQKEGHTNCLILNGNRQLYIGALRKFILDKANSPWIYEQNSLIYAPDIGKFSIIDVVHFIFYLSLEKNSPYKSDISMSVAYAPELVDKKLSFFRKSLFIKNDHILTWKIQDMLLLVDCYYIYNITNKVFPWTLMHYLALIIFHFPGLIYDRTRDLPLENIHIKDENLMGGIYNIRLNWNTSGINKLNEMQIERSHTNLATLHADVYLLRIKRVARSLKLPEDKEFIKKVRTYILEKYTRNNKRSPCFVTKHDNMVMRTYMYTLAEYKFVRNTMLEYYFLHYKNNSQ